MSEWKAFREELLQDADTKAAYDAHAVDRAIARAIIAQRIAEGLTQQEVADRMEVPQGNVSRLESGATLPTLGTLQKVANALGVTLTIHLGEQIVPLCEGNA